MSSTATPRDLISVVKATLLHHGMVRAGDTLLVAVSGGPDSMALLTALHLLAGKMAYNLIVAHVDHKLRPESHEDALFVQEAAQALGVPIYTTEADVRARALARGRGVEEAGRRVRYDFFHKVKLATGAHRIATAHQADDAIETFFFRILTGAGPQGLTGIAPTRGDIIRPLIRCYRFEIMAFLEARSIPYRLDPTNATQETDRNFLRNDVLPLIASRFPNFKKPLLRTLELIRQDEELLHDLASGLRAVARTAKDGETVLAVAPLRQAGRPLAARAIIEAFYDLSGSDQRWTKAHVDSILAIVHGDNPSASVHLPGGIVAIREYDRIVLRVSKQPAQVWTPMTISTEGRVEVPGMDMVFDFRIVDSSIHDDSLPADPDRCEFDADLARFPLQLRPPIPGDRFKPWGFHGTRKLKKLLIEHKVPLSLRKRLPLLVKDGEVLWIPGIRRSSLAAIGPHTRRVLAVHVAQPR